MYTKVDLSSSTQNPTQPHWDYSEKKKKNTKQNKAKPNKNQGKNLVFLLGLCSKSSPVVIYLDI